MKVGLSGLVTNTMSTRTVERHGNTIRTRIEFRDAEGHYRGAISKSEPAKSPAWKKKRFPYNHKEISAQLMRTKTPGEASRVAARARRRVAQLLRSKKNSEYDEAEIEAALLHAEQMERVAVKRKKHLEIEEQAARGIEQTKTEAMMEQEEESGAVEETAGTEGADETGTEEELLNGMSEEDIEQILRELEQEMEAIEESADDFAESMDEMSEALSGDMEPADLEEMKKKHRADEQRDIIRADMKYLKALFDKLAREKAQAKAASALSNLTSSVPAEARSPVSSSSGSQGDGGGGAASTASAAATSVTAAPAPGGTIDMLA